MSLASFVSAHESQQKTLTVFGPDPIPGLADHFDTPGIEVRWEPLPDGSESFLTVTQEGEFIGSVPAAAVQALVSPGDPPDPGDAEFDDWALRRLFVLLRDAAFSALDRSQLLAAAREFEDRAVRMDEGSLHTGFQRPAPLRAQADLYTALAAETNLDVHIYLDAEWDVSGAEGEESPVPGATVHAETGTELGNYWFVLFDGGPDALSACGLVAEERDERAYYGVWTYDATRVNEVLAYLQETY